mgnify:CR=1 FL=1
MVYGWVLLFRYLLQSVLHSINDHNIITTSCVRHYWLRPLHSAHKAVKNAVIFHTHYNFFSQLQRFFLAVLYMGNVLDDVFWKIFAVLCVACDLSRSLGWPLCVSGEWGEGNYNGFNRRIDDNYNFYKKATPSADKPTERLLSLWFAGLLLDYSILCPTCMRLSEFTSDYLLVKNWWVQKLSRFFA